MSQFGQKGMLFTLEHSHLLEHVLEDQTLRFHATEIPVKSGTLATFGPQEKPTLSKRGPLGTFVILDEFVTSEHELP